MLSRPQAVTSAAVLLVLLSLFNFPWPWLLLFPGAEPPPAFVFYTGFALGFAGLVVAVGLWRMKAWSYLATNMVCVLNLFSGAPGIVFGPTAGIRVLSAVLEVVALLIIVLGSASVLPACFRSCPTTLARTVGCARLHPHRGVDRQSGGGRLQRSSPRLFVTSG
jgi:hypothetical protein